jgi:DNA-directed RNA polymerase subunit RPC12/RpoP
MKAFKCPHCGQTHFTTLCSDCLAEEISIQETRSVFHIGRCHRCGHTDDELCSARVGSGEILARAPQNRGSTLKGFTQRAVKLAARAADVITGHSARPR